MHIFRLASVWLFIYFISSLTCDQAAAQSWQWAARTGGPGGNINDNPNEAIMDIKQDSQGYSYVCGRIGSNADFNGTPVTTFSASGYLILIAKLDCAGNTVWIRSAGSNIGSEARALALDNFGNIYVTGRILASGTNGCVFLDTAIFDQTIDFFLAKLDTAGNFKWLQCAAPGNAVVGSIGYNIEIDPQGMINVAGRSPAGLLFPGFNFAGWSFIARFDTAGNVNRVLNLCESQGQDFNDYKMNSLGDQFITGYFNADSVTIGTQTLNKISGCPACYDMYLAKFDSAGIFQWVRHFGDTIPNFVTGTGIGIDGTDVLLTGEIINTITIDGFTFNNNLNSNTGEDFPFIAKFNSSGTAIWATNTHHQFQSRSEAGITVLSNGSAWIGGYFGGNANLGGSSFTSNGLRDIFIAQVNSSGVIQQGAVITGSGISEAPRCIANDSNNNIFIGGGFDGTITVNGTNYSNAGGISDGFIAKFGTQTNCTVGLEEFPSQDKQHLVIYPNPVLDVLQVKLSGTGNQTVQLFNSQGRKVFEKQYTKSGIETCQIDMKQLPAGMYLVVLTDQKNTTSGRVIKN